MSQAFKLNVQKEIESVPHYCTFIFTPLNNWKYKLFIGMKGGSYFFHTIKIDKRFDCNFLFLHFVNPQFLSEDIVLSNTQQQQYYKIFSELLLNVSLFFKEIFPQVFRAMHTKLTGKYNLQDQKFDQKFLKLFHFVSNCCHFANLRKFLQVILITPNWLPINGALRKYIKSKITTITYYLTKTDNM